MGADFFALMRLFRANRFRVRPAYLPDCLIDVMFSLANTALGVLQSMLYANRVDRTELEEDPIFIIGHWRTGTTWLHELMAVDPRNRCPTTYECFAPHHFLLTEPYLKRWTGFTVPRRRPQDDVPMGWDRPQEDEFALCLMGAPSPYWRIAFPNVPPSCRQYLDLDEVSEAERGRWKRSLMRFARQLTVKRPGRLVLKSPPHTCRLPVLAELFPSARFIHLVRDPYAVFPSTVRLWKALWSSQGYQKPHFRGLEEFVFETFSHVHERLEATRRLIPRSRFYDMKYEDLAADPIGRIRDLYERLDLGPFDGIEPALTARLADRAGYKPRRYDASPEVRAQICRRWAPYFEKYGYAAE